MKFKNNFERAQAFFERTKDNVTFVSHEDIENFLGNQWRTLTYDFIVYWKTFMIRYGKMPQAARGYGYKIISLSFEMPNFLYKKTKYIKTNR